MNNSLFEGMTLQPEQIKTGELYLYFQQPTRPKRCHVVSQSRSGIQIYLIDDGKIRHCKEHELYVLDEEFREFPARAIEIFVLGYKPNDNNTKWLPGNLIAIRFSCNFTDEYSIFSARGKAIRRKNDGVAERRGP